jgi:hypothetical protein
MSSPASGRSREVLSRLPAHLDAARPGTQLQAVTGAVASAFDRLAADLAAVRRSHRLAHAGTVADLGLLGALHAIGGGDLALGGMRTAAVAVRLAALQKAIAAGAPNGIDAAAEALFDLWGVDAPRPRLALFAPPAPAGAPAGPLDLAVAAGALAEAAGAGLTYAAVAESVRTRVGRICRLHTAGNGTVRTLLAALLNALDLEPDTARNAAARRALAARGETGALGPDLGDGLLHSADLFFHATFVLDRAPLVRTVAAPAPAKRVQMGERIAAAELASGLAASAAELAAGLAELGIAVAADGTLAFADAERVAARAGFAVERFPRGAARIGGAPTAGELGGLLGVRLAELAPRLAALGAPLAAGAAAAAAADTAVAPEIAARVARTYGFTLEQALPAALEAAGIEENPLGPEALELADCRHAQLFQLARRGFGREALTVEVTGVDDKTVGPMLVNRDQGRGIGFFGKVPAGKRLAFTPEGRVTLEGADVTAFAFSWQGACFAEHADPLGRPLDRHDFVLDGPGVDPARRAVFAVATPEGALDRDFSFPHAGAPIRMPGLGIGVTRFAFFVQEAHLSSRTGTPAMPVVQRVTPHPAIAFADLSVFAAAAEARPAGLAARPMRGAAGLPEGAAGPAGVASGLPGGAAGPAVVAAGLPGAEAVLTSDAAGPAGGAPRAAALRLSWLEHAAYALSLLIPRRFTLLETAGEPAVADRVRAAVERFRPAGVAVRVEAAEERWVVGKGFMIDAGGEDPVSLLRGGTVLWPAPPG